MTSSGTRLTSTREEHTSNFNVLANRRVESAHEVLECGTLTASSVERPNSECVKKAMSEESSRVNHNLDIGLWSTLDDNLLEKIIARLSFKSFFRASSSLSKTWTLRFHSSSFQQDLYERSSSWESYCPVYMNSAKELVGYEIGSKRWHRLPTHSYLRQDAGWVPRAGAGSLFCWTVPYPATPEGRKDPRHIHVTNPLTKSSKQLPLRPMMQFPTFVYIDLDGSTAYKVILGTTGRETCYRDKASIRVQIFDSRDESWTMAVHNFIRTNIRFFPTAETTFMNGVLYVLVRAIFARGYGYALITLDLKNAVWSEIPLQFQAVNEDPTPRGPLSLNFHKVFVCESHVMMAIDYTVVVSNRDCTTHINRIKMCRVLGVFKVDVEHGLFFEVCRAPNDLLHELSSKKHASAVAHDGHIYITSTDTGPLDPPLLVCNVRTRQWHQIPYPPNRSLPFHVITLTSYQPGLNSLLEV